MAIKNIFLDRDGVINEIVMREGKISSPRSLSEFSIRKEFAEFHQQLIGKNLNLFVVSNQPDVSRRLLKQDDLAAMTSQLDCFQFKEIIYCVHDDSHNCLCRKPKPGMITRVLDKHGLAPEESLLIGDGKKDILAGQAASIRTIYLKRSYNPALDCQPDYIIDTLADAVGIIMHE